MSLDQFLSEHVYPSSQHRSFYHFTDGRNLPAIRQHGLLCRRRVLELDLDCITGGNEWSLDADQRYGLDNFVHLCFFNQHPMEYRARTQGQIENVYWLRVNPEIIRENGVKVTNMVSNSSDAALHEADNILSLLDLEVIYKKTNWRDPAVQERLALARKCELLVPDRILASFIENISG